MSWRPDKVGNLCKVGRGSSPRPINDERYFIDGTIPWIKVADATASDKYLLKTKQHVNELGASFSRLLPSGSLIICTSGTLGYPVFLGVEGCIHDGWLYTYDYVGLEPEFFYYFLLTMKNYFSSVAYGAAIQNINTEILRNTPINLPDIDSQKKIGSVLKCYDDLIANNHRRIELLEQAARLLFKEWFVKLRYPGHEHDKIVDGTPHGWHRSKLSNLGLVVTGKTPSKSLSENFGLDVPFVKTPDMRQAVIVIETEESLSERGAATQNGKTLPKYSTLVSCIGTVGIVALNGLPAQTNQQINSIIPARPELRFFNYFVACDLKPRLEAIGGGVTMANVNKSKFEALPVLLPTESLLHDFDAFCDPIFETILRLESANRILGKARDLLLPRLMDGRIAV
jgi:type I restriction enzyme S subunit